MKKRFTLGLFTVIFLMPASTILAQATHTVCTGGCKFISIQAAVNNASDELLNSNKIKNLRVTTAV